MLTMKEDRVKVNKFKKDPALVILLANLLFTTVFIVPDRAFALEVAGNKTVEIDSISTVNYANKRLDYAYYIPTRFLKNNGNPIPVLICVPGLSGRGEGFITSDFINFADKEGFIIISPSFVWDSANWSSKTSYQYPDAWSGNALIEIVNKVKEKHGLNLSKYYLYGFSAGAQFALRFAVWRPDLCAACAAHASGGTVIPQQYCDVNFFVSVGKDDLTRIEKTEGFYKSAKTYGISTLYKQYDGGHTLPIAQVKDSLEFIKSMKNRQ